MKAGAATLTINNELGTQIQGAGIRDQRVEAIRDDLEANALYLNDGDTDILFISCDLVGLDTGTVRQATQAIAEATDIEAHRVLIGCSHTHGGPVMMRSSFYKPVDTAYLERLVPWLVEVSHRAMNSAQTANLGWGMGRARLGYNRRVCYADDTHNMYRKPGRDADMTGLEGPDDPACLAMGIFDGKGTPQAVLHHGTGHPASFYGQRVLTSDFPGVARRLLREVYGAIPVLFFNGAQGDIAMRQQVHPQATADRPEIQIMRYGSTLAGETLRLLHEMQPTSEVCLRHLHRELEFPVRLPDRQTLDHARNVVERMRAGEDIAGAEAIFAWGPVSLAEQFGEHPVDRLPFHALRINDLAIATQPFELFCQYQIDLKRRSPSAHTAWFGLTNGSGGYLPTLYGALGGGYSGTPFAWARFAPEVGCRVVDRVAAMLHELWRS